MERFIVAQGSIPEFKNDGDNLDKIYLPARGVQTATGIKNGRGEAPLVVLPESAEVKEFVEETKVILNDIGLADPETLLVPDTDYFLDLALEANLELLTERLDKSDNNILWPYANTKVSDGWMEKLRQRGFKISNALPRKEYKPHQTRSIWGRRVSRSNEPSFPQKYGIPYPISYVSNGSKQLLEAYNIVTWLSEDKTAWLKLSSSAGGFGLAKVSSLEEAEAFYQLSKESGSLNLFGSSVNEIDIEVQENITNAVGFGSYQYNGSSLLTPSGVSTQILEGKNWAGNKFNVLDGNLAQKASEIHRRLAYGMNQEGYTDFVGWGGVDVAIVRNEDSVDLTVVENNWGRITGAHPGIYFAKALGISEKPFMVRKLKPPKVSAEECWKLLKKENLAYDTNSKNGAVPIPWVRNVDAFLFVAGENDSQIMQMTERIMDLTIRNGYH